MRVYISGPMTGHPDHNIPAFDAAAKRLREEGHFVINPAELSAQFGTPEGIAESFKILYAINGKSGVWEYHKERAQLAQSIMDADLAAVRSCDAIYMLKGWENSRGAKAELAEAIAHGLQVMQEGVDA